MADLPPLDPGTLGFDAAERLQATARMIAALPLAPDSPVLDAGGHPCLLARLLAGKTVVTADTLPGGLAPGYVRATGARLPFAAKTFGAATASDTLEHVPPAARQDFLQELWRVTSGYLLVSGPYDTAGVAAAEAELRRILGDGTPRAAWLREHAENGLPDLAATAATLERLGGRCAIVPSGNLVEWFILMALDDTAAAATGPAWAGFLAAWNRTNPLTAAAVAYRHMILCAKPGHDLPAGMTLASEYLDRCGGESQAAAERIAILAAFITTARQALDGHGGRATASPEAAYVRQLENALAHQRTIIERLEAQGAQSQPGMVKSLINRLRNPQS